MACPSRRRRFHALGLRCYFCPWTLKGEGRPIGEALPEIYGNIQLSSFQIPPLHRARLILTSHDPHLPRNGSRIAAPHAPRPSPPRSRCTASQAVPNPCRGLSKVVEETEIDTDKMGEGLDVNRDSMTPSAESGWSAASYHSTPQCVWKDTQWDFLPPPTGVQEWVHFLESDDEDGVVSSELVEVTLPYLDSNSTTPTSTGGVPYCADSPTPTLTSESLEQRSKDDKCKRHYNKEEERTSLLCLDYDYTAVIVYGEHFNDDVSSLVELGRKRVPKPTPSHPHLGMNNSALPSASDIVPDLLIPPTQRSLAGHLLPSAATV